MCMMATIRRVHLFVFLRINGHYSFATSLYIRNLSWMVFLIIRECGQN